MGVMNFSIPDDVKEAFNAAFEGQNKSAIVAELMRRAVEDHVRKCNGNALIEQMRRLQAMGPSISDADIKAAREEGRP